MNLERADLSGVNLSNANLVSADLEEANLSNANLSGANLTNADLEEANLTGANLREWLLDERLTNTKSPIQMRWQSRQHSALVSFEFPQHG